MICHEFRARVEPYVDGELSVEDSAAAEAHLTLCPDCAGLARREREVRRLLRAQPREAAPPELRQRIVARLRRDARWQTLRPWVLMPALGAAAAVLTMVILGPVLRPTHSLVAELVDKHVAFAHLERPAELATGDRVEVARWFLARAGLRVVVPDYSPSGIRLVGARLADARGRQAAHLLYEKGRMLLSVFMLPLPAGDRGLGGRRVSYRGREYWADELKGYRTVWWTEGPVFLGLVSALDDEALLECADRLRVERAQQTRL